MFQLPSRNLGSDLAYDSETWVKAFNRIALGPSPALPSCMMEYQAKFNIGQVVSHRLFGFRGVIYDVDPQYANTEAWYEAIPKEIRPHKNQPFYHLLAQNETGSYEAYVSEQNLIAEENPVPVEHPGILDYFEEALPGHYQLRNTLAH